MRGGGGIIARAPGELLDLERPLEMVVPQNSVEAGKVLRALDKAFKDAHSRGMSDVVNPVHEAKLKQVLPRVPSEYYVDTTKEAVAVNYPYKKDVPEDFHSVDEDFEVDLVAVARVMHDKYRALHDDPESPVLPQYRALLRDVAEMPDILYMPQTGEFGRALLDAFEDIRAENAGYVDVQDEQLAKIMDMLYPEAAQPQASLDA